MKKLVFTFALISALLAAPLPASAELDPCDLANQDVSGCDYAGRDLFNGVLNDKNMSGTNLSGLTSRFSYWERTNLTNADMTFGNFYYADFIDTNLTSADLSYASLISTTLTGADFTGATLTGVRSGNITGEPAALPEGWKLTVGYLVGPGANLSGANLAGADLTGVNLTGADLTGVRSGGIVGNPTLPDDWQLLGGYLFGPGADLSYAKLDGLGIWFIDLTNAVLTGASVQGTDFVYPKSFQGVRSGGIVGNLQSGARIIKGYLVAPKVNLEGANLQGADLSSLDLEGINIRGADLSQADLMNANMPTCNATNTNFTGADLRGANMRSCIFVGTKFNEAKMTDTMLGSSTITGAEFYNSKFLNTEFLFSTVEGTRSSGITGTIIGSGNITLLEGVIYNRFVDSFMPVMEDEVRVGNMISVNALVPRPELATVKVQWLRNGQIIPRATSFTYFVQPEDFGKNLSFEMEISMSGYLPRADLSPERSVGLGTMSTGAVQLLGKAKVGSTLSAKTPNWVPGAKKSYSWTRNGTVIKGATKSNYKLTSADKGKRIAVKITQSRSGYGKATKSSAALTVR